MFAIKILIAGVFFVAILNYISIFQVRSQKAEIHGAHSYVGICAYFLRAFVNLVSESSKK